ncbi:succinate dehydrogenase, hydrophobic membrane anchor protein [Legionella quateirensis]|jgi:succinate dehydrogenase / fumarate reductase membrane anchor subunit|uniref:Succinate dehydrogenase hydrophobic membrane anchor subunit n=1 Tax=Legionella quateirensis TaxID=45072 RepID=A0A378KX33_9GAMM|nr:succinate dehydrogenase, hydrophobic membrane anchor protein [Legionella quateirensis]KTD52718.1 succinate dehydrogenase, hydrophobic membrane anchor protein [Legionella quateirensis]STY19135.1 succinate dehydrogenase, hydrophobic membrane anchor protein [Legionella quateirensis]
MVTNVTSLTGNGLKDWLIQRVTAVFFAAYAIFLFGFLIMHPDLNFEQWQLLFNNTLFQIATAIGLLALSLHAWIGIWTVTTDYMKCTAIRLAVQMVVVLWLLSQFIWGLMIVWGQ